MAFEFDVGLLTTEQLVIRLRNAPPNERSACCREIIERFEPLLRKAWRKAAFRVGYQDFVQEVFVRLFADLNRLKDSRAFPGYLRTIALRVACDSLRNGPPEQASPESIDKMVSHFDDEIIKSIHIKYCLEMLPSREKVVIRLEFFEGRSVKEIASALQISPTAVRVTKHRARKRLKQILLDQAKKLEEKV